MPIWERLATYQSCSGRQRKTRLHACSRANSENFCELESQLVTNTDIPFVRLQAIAVALVLPGVSNKSIDRAGAIDLVGDARGNLWRNPGDIECVPIAGVENVPRPVIVKL